MNENNNNKKKFWCYVSFFAPMSGPIPIEALDEKDAEEKIRKGLTEVKELEFLKITTEGPDEFMPPQEFSTTMHVPYEDEDEAPSQEESNEKKVIN